MKLRNKKTGEIIELLAKPSFVKRNENFLDSEINTFDSLAEIEEEWEDYEEPKEYWYIDAFGNIVQNRITKHRGHAYTDMSSDYETQKKIGNYFVAPEEAVKAVEKLKAWKRLKDKGFKFTGFTRHGDEIALRAVLHDDGVIGMVNELDLLFNGGEE